MLNRRWIYRQLDPVSWDGGGLSPVNSAILGLVVFSICAAVMQSEPAIHAAFPKVFDGLTAFFAVIFSAEYAIRLWAMGENPDFAGIRGRLRYGRTLACILDLVVVLALWIDLLMGFSGIYGVLLRLARALRVLTLMRRSAVADAIRTLFTALQRRQLELFLSFALAGVVLLISATLLFAFEGPTQPKAFGSIPRAMWWAMATLTTVGYGDVYPVTAMGKVFASISALTSIAIVAMPTGIMAAAFSDAFQSIRSERTRTGETGP